LEIEPAALTEFLMKTEQIRSLSITYPRQESVD
jgi:hypothetical protein